MNLEDQLQRTLTCDYGEQIMRIQKTLIIRKADGTKIWCLPECVPAGSKAEEVRWMLKAEHGKQFVSADWMRLGVQIQLDDEGSIPEGLHEEDIEEDDEERA